MALSLLSQHRRNRRNGSVWVFLDRYDVFYLSRAPAVRLLGGRPVFPEVPARTPEQVLARHGLEPHQQQLLDAEKGIAVVEWRRSAKNQIE
jgi:hypothetical protein